MNSNLHDNFLEILKGYLDQLAISIAKTVVEKMQTQNTLELQKPEYLTIKEACTLLKVTRQTLKKYRKKYPITSEKMGGRVLILKDSLFKTLHEKKYARA